MSKGMYEYKIIETMGPESVQGILNYHSREGWNLHTLQVYGYPQEVRTMIVWERIVPYE